MRATAARADGLCTLPGRSDMWLLSLKSERHRRLHAYFRLLLLFMQSGMILDQKRSREVMHTCRASCCCHQRCPGRLSGGLPPVVQQLPPAKRQSYSSNVHQLILRQQSRAAAMRRSHMLKLGPCTACALWI